MRPYRLELNDILIDDDTYTVRTLQYFLNHIVDAITVPNNFTFDGYGCKYDAKEFIAHHEKRLSIKFEGVLNLYSGDVLVDSFDIDSFEKTKCGTYSI